jgi:hypothetical protein
MSTAFLNAMRAKWAEFGNVESPALLDVWALIKSTLDWQAGPDASDVWPVIPAELGAGKSTAAKMWCVTAERPRVLIVVRTKDQADEYAHDINAWSGDPALAFAHHSGLPLVARRDLDLEGRAPAALVVLRQLEVEPLAVHPDGDMADAGPGVQPGAQRVERAIV